MKITVFLISLCLCIGLALCSQVAQLRKPQITITTKQTSDCSGTTLLYSGSQKSLVRPSKSVEDVSSIVKGAFHIEASNMLAGDLFTQPSANLLVAVDGLGQNDAIQSDLTGANSASGKCIAGAPSSMLSSAVTGVSANQHGIYNTRWINAKGAQEQAFSNENTFADVQTISDVFANHFEGKSLIISASASETLAMAASAHPMTVSQFGDSRIKSFFYNSKTGEFAGRDGKCKLASKANVAEKIAAFIPTLSSSSLTVSFDAEKKQVTVQVPEANAVTFSLNSEEDFLFFGELSMFNTLLQYVKSSAAVKSLVSDDAPDSFVFTVSSLRAIGTKYGFQSEQFTAAVRIVDAAVARLMSDFASIYNERTTGQVVLLGRAAEFTTAQKLALNAAKNLVNNDLADQSSAMSLLPGLYLKSSTTKERVEQLAADLSNALASVDLTVTSSTDAEQVPSTGRKLLYWSARVASAPSALLRNADKAAAANANAALLVGAVDYYNTTTPNFVTISEYQVSLWMALGFLFLLVTAAYTLGSIDYTHDSLLMTNDSGKEGF